MRRVLIIALSLYACVASAQSIFTVAGGGTDDGQLAADIPAHGPRGLAFDKAGNLYFVENGAGRVRFVDAATMRVYGVAGNGSSGFSGDGGRATDAALNSPNTIAFDSAGNLYIADSDNNRIRRVDAKGVMSTFAGGGDPNQTSIGDGGPATAALLFSPAGIVVSGGYLWFSENAYNGNRVRRVKLDTNTIETVAGAADGSDGFADGPGKDARFKRPLGLAADKDGNIYVADLGNSRVRRIDANLNVTTYAGNGDDGTGGDNGLATAAQLSLPIALAFDPAGNLVIGVASALRRIDRTSGIITTLKGPDGLTLGLAFDSAGNAYFADGAYGTIRKRSAASEEITTYAGGGSFIGDGRVATAAVLSIPAGLALDKAGNLYIADQYNTVLRRVDAATGTIRVVAGKPGLVYSSGQEDGIDAADAIIGGVTDVALDSKGNIYTADPHGDNIWKIDANGKIFRYAALDTGLDPSDRIYPAAIAFDSADNLFIADPQNHVVHRIDAATKQRTIAAGTFKKDGFAGDGGPAASALLNYPVGVALDADDNLFISDQLNLAIRRVDAKSKVITSFAGGGTSNEPGDNGPAKGATLFPTHIAVNRANGDLYIADRAFHSLRKVDAKTQTITTVAGSSPNGYSGDFSGDNGAAKAAKLNLGYQLSGVAITAGGDAYISDATNNRVRAVYACRASLDAAALTSPASNSSRSPVLSWRAVPGAFRYDVYLDTVNPPVKIIANDVAETSFTAANLLPSTRYYWKIVAKGDAFCTPRATSASATESFTTSGGCALGAFDTTAPAEGASVPSPVTLSWQTLAGAASYDVYLGPSNPPSLFASALTSPSLQISQQGTLYWFVTAHAACDAQITSATPVHTFTAGQGCQPSSVTVSPRSPADGATDVAVPVTLQWTAANASGFNVDFGTSNPPPAFATGLPATQLAIADLRPGTTYYWRVTAIGCGSTTQSVVASFTTRTCTVPAAPSFTFTPPAVTSGSTYTVVWSSAAGLDEGGGYLVERSTSAAFVTILDAQVTQSRAAAFVAGAPGTIYHRVRAVPACDPSKPGPVSEFRSVTVTDAPPNVVFSVSPAAAISGLGERIDSQRGSFTLENVTNSPLQVIVGRQELGGAPPFFSIVDPSGTDAAFVTLQPHVPRTFEIRYAGPRNDVAGSYEGVIFAAATGKSLAVTPYGFVNLKIGGSGTTAPELRVNGLQTDYAAFAPFASASDDAARAPLAITIANNGTTPMELAAEIGPEVWLVPESGWNASPLAPNSTRTVNLTTRRSRAPGGSSLPRYTYFTVRTRDGGSARMLIQDNDVTASAAGRASRLDPGDSTLIVPEAVSRISPANRQVVSRLWITNIGGEAVQVELTYTPEGADGFDATRVRRAVIVAPPNDVVTLTDPLVQIFGASRPARGTIEVRLPRERLGFVSVSSSIVALGAGTSYTMPIAGRGDGARASAPQSVIGVMKKTGAATSLTLVETSGVGQANVTLDVYNADGSKITTANVTVPRYGCTHIDDITPAANAVDGGRVDVSVGSGSGASVIALATISDSSAERGAVLLSSAFGQPASATSLARRMVGSDDTPSVTTVVPILPGSGASSSTPQKTEVVFSSPSGLSASFNALFRLASGAQSGTTKSFSVPAGASIVIPDVLTNLFQLSSQTPGSISVTSTNGGRVTAVVEKTNPSSPSPVPLTALPLPTTASDLLTGASLLSQRPLLYDGLEQSIDGTRGSRWMLVLNEMAGGSGTVNVRLYEAANRTTPIAQKDFTIAANQQLTLDTVFASLGLDAADRRKDRTNVQVVVVALSGAARVAATAVSVDNRTGDTQAHALTPGSALPSGSVVTPILPAAQQPVRRRTVGR